jgi:hypothetical protein
MSEREQVYPATTRELAEQRKRLAPQIAEAFKAFSRSVFAEGASHAPLVSSDIVGDPRASIVDLELTKVIDGDLVKGHELVRQ